MNKLLSIILLVIFATACIPFPAEQPDDTPLRPTEFNTPPAEEDDILPPSWTPNANYDVRFAWFYKPPEDKYFPLLPQRYDFFILTHRDEEQIEILRSLGLTQPIYQYLLFTEIEDPGDCETKPRGNQVAYLAGDFCRISSQHPDWFLLDFMGNRIKGENDYYNMDPGNPGFRAFWKERATELQTRHGWQGLFLDNVEASLSKYQKQLTLPRQYPTDASLQNAVEGFLIYLHEDFEQQERPIYANIIAIRDARVWLRYLNYLDGAMLENFAVDWLDAFPNPEEFATEMEMLISSQAMGKTLILVAQGDESDLARQQFAFASYLLINEGGATFRYAHHSAYRQPWWYANYEANLGLPLGPAYQQNGIWIRKFQNGQVTVNPREQTSSIEQK